MIKWRFVLAWAYLLGWAAALFILALVAFFTSELFRVLVPLFGGGFGGALIIKSLFWALEHLEREVQR